MRYCCTVICSGYLTKSRGSGVAKLTLLGEDEVWNIRAEFEEFNDVMRENFHIISLGECIDQGKEHQLLKQQPPNLSGLTSLSLFPLL